MDQTVHASVLFAAGALMFAVLWFLVKALIGHVMAHWMLAKARKRGWGRKGKQS